MSADPVIEVVIAKLEADDPGPARDAEAALEWLTAGEGLEVLTLVLGRGARERRRRGLDARPGLRRSIRVRRAEDVDQPRP